MGSARSTRTTLSTDITEAPVVGTGSTIKPDLMEVLANCVTDPGALAGRDHASAMRRLEAINMIARSAMVQWGHQQGESVTVVSSSPTHNSATTTTPDLGPLYRAVGKMAEGNHGQAEIRHVGEFYRDLLLDTAGQEALDLVLSSVGEMEEALREVTRQVDLVRAKTSAANPMPAPEANPVATTLRGPQPVVPTYIPLTYQAEVTEVVRQLAAYYDYVDAVSEESGEGWDGVALDGRDFSLSATLELLKEIHQEYDLVPKKTGGQSA